MRALSFAVFTFILFYSFPALSQNWDLIWSEEFNGKTLDTSIWNYEIGNGEGGWGTGQIDYCTDRIKNVDVRDGKLFLTCRKEEFAGFHYTAGKINSKNKYFTKYGKIEARIKIPQGKGIGAAFWMLPQFNKYGWWPRSGEIDILEINGHEHHVNYGTVHYMQWETHQYKGHDIKTEKDLVNEFADYTIIWDEKAIKWYLDGKLFNELSLEDPIDNRKPFNEEFYFILSTGVGSDFSGKIIEDSLLPTSMEVDYIRVYKEVYPPKIVLAKSTADGKNIEVSFSEELKEGEKSYRDFEIKNKDKPLLVSNATMRSRDDRTIVFQLAEPIDKFSEVKINYNGVSLKSKSNQQAEKFFNVPVINYTIGAAPVISSVKTMDDSYSIELIANKELLENIPSPTDFVITVNDRHVDIESIEIGKNNHRLIKIKLRKPLFKTDTIKVAYSGVPIRALDGGEMYRLLPTLAINTLGKKSVVPGKIEAESYIKQEGIVVENTNDDQGGKNVGYVEDNDWMEYEIYVSKSGMYKLNYRFSSASSGGSIVFQIDGKTNDTILLKPTYNWQSWSTITSPQKIELKEGIHKVKVIAEKGGFNLNWISLTEN